MKVPGEVRDGRRGEDIMDCRACRGLIGVQHHNRIHYPLPGGHLGRIGAGITAAGEGPRMWRATSPWSSGLAMKGPCAQR